MVQCAEKRVSRTDVGKKAYVPDEWQRKVLSLASVEPVDHTIGRTIPIRVAGTEEVLHTTYYPSARSGSGRQPEMRMGRDLANWVSEGDVLWIGTDGKNGFVTKSSQQAFTTSDESRIEQATESLAKHLDLQQLLKRARATGGPPSRKESQSMVFERSPAVRAFAIVRSGGKCEFPGCTYIGFQKPDGSKYIEVHHVQSLARDGHDIIENVAAICPNHHAMAHYSSNVVAIERQLVDAIEAANKRLGLI